MLKVLVADKVSGFAKRVAEYFSGRFEVRVCENGAEVLELCRLWQPDYMLLDMELTLVDGLTILQTLHSSGQMIHILAKTSCVYDNYMGQNLSQLGIHYFLPNPCTVTAAVSQLNSLISFERVEQWDDDDRILNLMLHLGLRYGTGGFACTCEALRIMMHDAHLPLTKVVYPQVARICGGNGVRVERAIRSTIDKAWENRDDRVWQYYFSPGRDGQIACPTNGEFLCRMALCLSRRKVV